METDLPSSPRAAKEAGVVHYYTGKPCARGHISKRFASTAQCVKCQAFHMKNAYDNDPEKFRERSRKDFHTNKTARLDRAAKWRVANPNYGQEYAAANVEFLIESRRRYNQFNRPLKAFYWAKYANAKRKATPSWLTYEQEEQIKEFYIRAGDLTLKTGIDHDVDHIVPIQGKNVCGLHVPWNLQVITSAENGSKGNKHGS